MGKQKHNVQNICEIANTVERRYNEGSRDWQNLLAITRFFSSYFAITGVKKIICYTEDLHCTTSSA